MVVKGRQDLGNNRNESLRQAVGKTASGRSLGTVPACVLGRSVVSDTL